MSKQRNICLSEKNSTQQTTLFHETERPAFKNPFSWQTVADVLNSLPLGVCACKTVHDAKMYVYCLDVRVLLCITPIRIHCCRNRGRRCVMNNTMSFKDRKEPELELLENLFKQKDADEWIRDISEIFDDLIDVRYNKNDTNLTSLVCIRRLQQFFMDMKEKGY